MSESTATIMSGVITLVAFLMLVGGFVWIEIGRTRRLKQDADQAMLASQQCVRMQKLLERKRIDPNTVHLFLQALPAGAKEVAGELDLIESKYTLAKNLEKSFLGDGTGKE